MRVNRKESAIGPADVAMVRTQAASSSLTGLGNPAEWSDLADRLEAIVDLEMKELRGEWSRNHATQ